MSLHRPPVTNNAKWYTYKPAAPTITTDIIASSHPRPPYTGTNLAASRARDGEMFFGESARHIPINNRFVKAPLKKRDDPQLPNSENFKANRVMLGDDVLQNAIRGIRLQDQPSLGNSDRAKKFFE